MTLEVTIYQMVEIVSFFGQRPRIGGPSGDCGPMGEGSDSCRALSLARGVCGGVWRSWRSPRPPPGFRRRLVSSSASIRSRAYVAIQRSMTALSNTVPFALLDVLLITVIGAWLALAVRDLTRKSRTGLLRAAATTVGRTVVWAAALYLVFLVVWGLNYRRTPLREKLRFDAAAVTADAARSLALTSADQLNALHGAAHAAGWPEAGAIDSALAESLAQADREIGGRGLVRVGRPKSTLLDWYFRRAAVAGMTDPFFLETLVSDLAPAVRTPVRRRARVEPPRGSGRRGRRELSGLAHVCAGVAARSVQRLAVSLQRGGGRAPGTGAR